MDRFQYVCDVVFAVLFGLLGVVALTGVLFCGAWWHLGTIVACSALVWILGREANEFNNKTKQ